MRLSYSASAMRLPVLAFVLGTGLFGGTAAALPTSTLTVTANCGQGQTISDTLKQGAAGQPLMVVVQGTCNENLVVDRDDVTLQGDPSVGGAVNGPDAGVDAIIVTGRRVTITGLTVTGGKNAIRAVAASAMTVQNSTIQNSGRNGIVFFQGASGTVDNCTVQANPRDGISIEAASATIINSSITGNSRVGVLVTDGGSARIGVSNLNVAAGNTISGNGSNGIHLSIGAGAFIEANTISGNGTDPAAPLGRFGIGVFNATGDVIGSNAITGNASHGIFARSASLLFGDPNFGIPTANTITGNGSLVTPSAGIVGVLGTSFEIRNATISGNNGFGVVLSGRSSAEVSGNTIQNNTGTPPFSGDGIRLVFGSALFIVAPPAAANTVTGNVAFGLNCTDPESSVVNTFFLVLSPVNGLGGVSPACTAF
jgi:parallel beta-helix repeat protein